MAKAEPTPERLHALDAVRGFALMLGVVLHATLSFVPTSTRFWIIQDSHPSMTLGVLFFVIHVFRMTTFFLIAGFFARLSFHRRGAFGFIKDRLQRIALPLVVGWPILFAAMGGVIFWAAGFPNGGPPPGSPGWPPVLPRFPSHPSLVSLCAAGILCRRARAAQRRGLARPERQPVRASRSSDRPNDAQPPRARDPGRPIGIAFSLDPTWVGWSGVRTPDNSLVTNLQAVIGFGTAFGFGWLLHRQIDLIRNLEQRWLLNLVLAIVLIAASFLLAGASELRPRPIGYDAIRLACAVCYALAIWTTSFAAIGGALRFLSGFSPARRYLADASYWIYLIHLPIVMALQVAVSQP